MGILDRIANPQLPNFLEGLKVISNLETARTNRRIAEIQAGSTLQQMQAKQQQVEQRRKGIETIGEALQPQEAAPVSPIQEGPAPQEVPTGIGEQAVQPTAEQPPTEGAAPAEEPALTPQQGKQVIQHVTQMPKAEIDEAGTFTELANKLAAQGNMDLAKVYYQIAEKTDEKIKNQTKEERRQSEQALEMAFRPLANVIKLQEAGNTEQAKSAYNQLIDRLSSDPRFSESEEVQALTEKFGTYQPGLAKYLYTTTAYVKNAREQLQKAEGTYTKVMGDGKIATYKKGTNEFVDYLRDAKGEPIVDYRATKEAGVTKRAKDRLEQAKTVQTRNKAKFDIKNTDSILRYKRQEDADLGDIKSSLQRAFILAEKGEDLSLVDKLLQQGMSKWENTSVRAQAELEKFAPQKIGGLKDRIANSLKLFFAGEMTEATRGKILDTARTLLNEYIEPQLDKSNTYWRRIADERGLDPDQITPYKTPEAVGEDLAAGTISRATAERILAKPRFKMK